MRVIKFVCRLSLLGLTILMGEMIFAGRSQALPYGVGTYGTCQYSTCSISLSSDGLVSLTVTPTSGGAYSTLNDDVIVETHSSTGYTLTMKDSNTDTNLINGAETIAPTTGTQASPVTLGVNLWGYRVDGLSGFGAGPTTVQNSEPSSSFTFAGVPASSASAHTLKTTSVPADPAETTQVWYGMRVDSTKPSGTYSDQVTYTAVVNN